MTLKGFLLSGGIHMGAPLSKPGAGFVTRALAAPRQADEKPADPKR